MLVLTRKLGEAIKIGDHIEIKIVAIDGDQIKLGIEAPKDVDIYRKEVYEAIQEENSLATQMNFPNDLIKMIKTIKKD
ncbi:carbon storage regulator CsrA [Terrilactibacillus sp. BCM23-1]|uniref:Translational regulator CsrA n=1 Tax=Terrilactibacillus tamarindi TaxID=2599694 RepID=A0A6N8CR55_9BACI|nr:carbon storage regulator CsrA [Terrilactibacillus tamarindi]MTT31563.1 carbon storage regulator CsrA [Terrilactibacillus tamarindi]